MSIEPVVWSRFQNGDEWRAKNGHVDMRVHHHAYFAAGRAKFVSVYRLPWARRRYQALLNSRPAAMALDMVLDCQ